MPQHWQLQAAGAAWSCQGLVDSLSDDAEAVARVKGTSVNQLIVDSLTAEIDRVRADADFTERAKRLLKRDKELLERLAR